MSNNKNTYILRSEFIEEFNKKNKIKLNNQKNKKKKRRWELLYNQGKMMKIKGDKYREEILEKRNKKENKECTFSPKKFNKFIIQTESESGKNIDNFINRQNKWLEKRSLSLEGMKEKKNNKDIEECYFEPLMVKTLLFKCFFSLKESLIKKS